MSYIKDKKGNRIDIRKKIGKALTGYAATQGACSDGNYIYMAFENKKISRIRIIKLILKKNDIKIKAVSKPLNIGHANDMAYKKGILYVTHSGTSNKIHRVEASTLKKLKDVTAPAHGMNAIAPTKNGFIIRVIGKPAIIVNDNFKKIRSFKWSKTYKAGQGMDYKNKKIIRAYSILQSKNKNKIAIYNTKGKIQRTKTVKITGELEGVFYHKNKWYGTSFRKKKKNGKMKHYAFIFTISL